MMDLFNQYIRETFVTRNPERTVIMQREIVIILSPENENPDITTLDDLFDFIVNELENADIGAYLEIRKTVQHN